MPRDTLASGSNARYIRHVAGGAGTLLGNGFPMDAGTGMVLASNAVHLRNESLRHVICSGGPGAIVANKDGWSDLAEDTPPAAVRTSTLAQIAWGYSTAACFGPFPIGQDNAFLAVGADDLARSVHVSVTCKSDGTHALTIYFAVTDRYQPPTAGAVAFETATTTSSSFVEVRSSGLTVRGQPTPYPTGVAGDPGGGVASVPEYYVWVGWLLAAGGTGAVRGFTGWEIDG